MTVGSSGQDHGADDLLTIAEAAELLKVSTVTVSRWRRDGRLPTLKVGPRAVRIRRADLDAVSRPYSGPASGPAAPVSAGEAGTVPAPSAHPGAVATASPAAAGIPVPPGPPTDLPVRTLARATLLRATILRRRNGEYLDPAGDDLGRLRDKRAKRRD